MRKMKKIVILFFMIIGILILGMLQVYAQGSNLETSGSLASTSPSKLKLNGVYHIGYNEYHKLDNLFCAEKGQKQWRDGRDYKVIAHVRIENSKAWLMNNKGEKRKTSEFSTENAKISKDYNKKLATAIATLKPEKLKYFIWGYFDTWVKNVGHKMTYTGDTGARDIPANFATYFKDSHYSDLVENVEGDMEEAGSSVEDFEDKTDRGAVKFLTEKIGDKEYWRVGPFNVTGVPLEGLKSLTIKNQNGDNITGNAKLIKYKADQSKIIIQATDSEALTAVIKSNKNFYICIPKDSNITSFTVEIKTNKVKGTDVKADIYLLKSSDKEWQNLVITDGKLTSGKGQDATIEINITMPGGLSLYKYDSISNQPLANAKFVIFRYVQAGTGKRTEDKSKGTWKADNSNGRGYEKAGDDEDVTRYKREYVRATDYTYHQTSMDTATKDSTYHFVTDSNGKIELSNLQPGTYYTKEIQAPDGYEQCKWKEWDGNGNFVKGNYEWFPIGEAQSGITREIKIPNTPETTTLRLVKVNEDAQEVKIENVAFKFYHPNYGWLKEISKNNYEYKANENEATWFRTESNGIIYLEGLPVGDWTYYEDPNSLPYGYDIKDKEKGTFKLEKKDGDNINDVTITNKQRWVKLSGYVWVDKSGSKTGSGEDRNEVFDNNGVDYLLDGITVKLINSETDEVRTATTAHHGWYADEGNNGHGEYMFEDVEIKDLPYLYIQFEYDGLTYTNVITNVGDNDYNGSKAAEGAKRRDNFNAGFSIIEGSGSRESGFAKNTTGKTQNLTYDISDNEAILNNKGIYTIGADEHGSYIKQDSLGAFPIQADTDNGNTESYGRSNIIIGKHIVWGQTEIRHINLGLRDRDQPDIGLTKDMHNVKVSVNGYEHTYMYNQKYQGVSFPGEDTFNVGVKFEEKDGSYTRAIYTSDYDYTPDNADNELKVYVTYELKMVQSNQNLYTKVNSIAEYFDKEYTIEKVGTEADEKGNIGGRIIDLNTISEGDSGNENYKKVIIPCELELEPQKENSIYVQFKLSKEKVKVILQDRDIENKAKKLLNNTAEINSYSIFSDKKFSNVYAGIDINSNPGNCELENFKTYENDTSAAPTLQLELVDAREMTGKVFEDDVKTEDGQKAEQIMTGKVREGSGIYEDSEKGIGGVEVTLKENEGTGSGMTYKAMTVTDDGWYHIEKDDTKTEKTEDGKEREYTFKATKIEQDDKRANTHYLTKGDFYIIGYIPGDYTLTYTWGDKNYTVQDYKGTIYKDKERKTKTDNTEGSWWYVESKYNRDGEEPQDGNNVTRYSDAIDNYETRQKIDEQIKKVTKDKGTNANVENAYLENATTEIITKMDSSTPTMKIDVEYRDAYTDSTGRKYAYCIDKLDFGIVERAKQDLVLTKRIKSLKATLANGQVIADIKIGEDGKIKGNRSGLTYMRPSPTIEPSNGFIRLELDNELIQGTKLEVGYEIKARNNSELDYIPKEYNLERGKDATFYKYGEVSDNDVPITITPTGIMDYLDRNWSFDSIAYQDTWTVMSANGGENDISSLVDEETVIKGEGSTIGEKMLLYTKKLAETALIPINAMNADNLKNTDTVDLNVSKVLTTTDNISLDNEAEEVEVTRIGGATLETIPGNYVPGSGAVEADDSMAETTIVTPATGENLNYIIPIAVGMTAMMILGAGIIIIKKKIL